MAKLDINAAISSSFDIVSRILFKPISIRMWLALGFASAMASVGSGGGSNLYNRSHPAGRTPGTGDISQNMRQFVETHLWLLVLAVVAIIALAVLFTWLASVFKFVYTDQIVRNSDEIREPFARLKSFGKSFFLWTLAYGLAVLLALGIFAALPILIGYYSLGAATAGGVTCIAIGVLLGVLIIIASIIADVFARDFVVTAMYKRHIGVMEAWREVLPILRANAGQLALYLLMLIVVGLAFVIISVFAAIAALIVIAIPAGLIAGICIAVALSAHLGWNPLTISVVVILSAIMLTVFAYLAQCLVQPIMVFRRAFGLVVLGQVEPSLATLDQPQPTPAATAPPASAP